MSFCRCLTLRGHFFLSRVSLFLFSAALVSLGMGGCLVPPEKKDPSRSWLPRTHQSLRYLQDPKLREKGSNELMAAFRDLSDWSLPFFRVLVTPHLYRLTSSQTPPPPRVVWLLGRLEGRRSLPSLKNIIQKSQEKGFLFTFIAGSLLVASFSHSPRALLNGVLLSKVTGYSLSKASDIASKYSCKDMEPVLRQESKTLFSSMLPLLVSGGVTQKVAEDTLYRSFWEVTSSWGCSTPQPKRSTPPTSLSSLGRVQAEIETCTHRASSSCVSDLLAEARSQSGDPLVQAVRLRALGWLSSRSPRVSQALMNALVDLTNAGITSSQEKLLARTILLSLNRIGEPSSQKRLQSLGPRLPSPLRPLWARVLTTLRRLSPRDLPHLSSLCESKDPLVLERAILELGRMKVGKKPLHSLCPRWAVKAYPRSVGRAHRIVLLWQ